MGKYLAGLQPWTRARVGHSIPPLFLVELVGMQHRQRGWKEPVADNGPVPSMADGRSEIPHCAAQLICNSFWAWLNFFVQARTEIRAIKITILCGAVKGSSFTTAWVIGHYSIACTEKSIFIKFLANQMPFWFIEISLAWVPLSSPSLWLL